MACRYLNRREAAEYLTREGFPCASKTLAKLACQGGGPQFIKFGLRVLYRPEDLICWAVNRCSWRSSTSDPGTPLLQRQSLPTADQSATPALDAGAGEPVPNPTDEIERDQ